MGEQVQERKPEELYPLLKVDGGGDGGTQPTQLVTPGCDVAYPRRKRWYSRWPEFMSACWMTMIIFGISFLVFYALGMSAYRRRQFIIVKSNASKLASNVFYHKIVPRKASVPFHWNVQYFAYMATTYPNLHFNIFFLIDDSYKTDTKINRLSNKLFAYDPYRATYNKYDSIYQAIVCFQKRYQNVNVTVIRLSEYMAGTPLRNTWRTVPIDHLLFYARVFSVWENGGVGMDLTRLRAEYEDGHTDRRIPAILRQHNDGIIAEDYRNTVFKIETEYNCVYSKVFNMTINEMFSLLFERAFMFGSAPTKPHIRTLDVVPTHRAKRDVPDVSSNNLTLTETTPRKTNNSPPVVQLDSQNKSNPITHDSDISNVSWPDATDDTKTNTTDGSKVVLFYDSQIISDDIGPTYLISETLVGSMLASEPKAAKSLNAAQKESVPKAVNNSNAVHLLTLDSEGVFVAASSKFHPLLGHLLSCTEYRSVAPKYAIQDTVRTQCYGWIKDDFYCNNLYIMYLFNK